MTFQVQIPLNICLVEISSPSHYALWNALSIETLAGDIRGIFGNNVSVVLKRVRQSSEIDDFIREIPTDIGVIGISVELGSLPLTRLVVDALKKLKKQGSSRPTIVFGNTIPTYIPSIFLNMCPSAIIIRGEGEVSFRGIVSHLLEDTPLEEVPSLVYRKGDSEFATPWKPPDFELLKFAPSLDTLPGKLSFQGSALMETSRGCPWSQCSYCSISSFRNGRLWEPLPFSRVVDNLRNLVEAGIRDIEFTDADFIGGRTKAHTERIVRLSEAIKEVAQHHNAQVAFRVFLTPKILYNSRDDDGNDRVRTALHCLKSAGLVKAYLGIESGCQSQIKRYRKGSQLNIHTHVLTMLRDDIGIELDFGFLLFDPDLTLEEMCENIRFFRENDLLRGNQWPFRPVRVVVGTTLCDALRASGRLGALDENLLTYSYNFSDERVQQIADAVDRLSAETREIFSAIKVVSRLQIDIGKRTETTSRAAQIVEENALIYLDLLEALTLSAKRNIPNSESLLQYARRRICELIDQVTIDVESGLLREHAAFLMPRLKEYRCRVEQGEVAKLLIQIGVSVNENLSCKCPGSV